MHWLGEHYQLGNALGISSYKMFGADKTRYFLEADQLSSSDLLERTRVELPRYLKALQGRGYTLPIGLLATGGFYIDNSPPDLRWCEVIERWNAEQNEIVLKTATVSEWFEALEYEGSAYPTHQVAWPDHWAHGLGSSTRRVAQARRNQRRRVGASLLVKQSGSQLAHQHLNTALESERFALEHTFDAWSTTLRIAASQNEYQQSSKELTFHRSEMFLEEAIGTALRALTTTKKDAAQKPEPHLYSLSTSAVGPRTLHFDAGDLTLNDEGNALVTPEGSTIAVQSDRPELAQFVAVCNPPSQQLWALKPKIDSSKISQLENSLRLETAGWALEIDPTTGTCMQLLDRVTGHDWVDHRSTKGFGALLHETVVHPLGRAATHNLARFVALDVGSETSCNEMGNQQVYRHNTCSQIGQARHLKGPVFDALEWSGEHPSIGQVKMAWRAYHGLPLIELVLDWNKTWNDLPEAAYVPFAFNAQGGTLELETGGGYFRPGQHSAGGQLAGTCSSYYTMQRAAHLRSPDGHSLLWLPLDAPLVMPQEINYSRWETGEYQWNGFLASMPVNHYWYTNFPTSQRGPIRLRYRFLNPTGYANREQALEAATPLEALGWR